MYLNGKNISYHSTQRVKNKAKKLSVFVSLSFVVSSCFFLNYPAFSQTALEIQRPTVARTLVRPNKQQRRSPEFLLRHDRVREAMRLGRIVPLSAIRKTIRARYKGRIVDVKLFELNNKNRPYIYNVRVLTKAGKLLSITVDATSAKVLSVKGNG